MKCKKFFALLLSLCMVFSTFVTVVNAEQTTTTVTVGAVEAEAGSEVVVPVTLTNNTAGICGLTLTFTYDANVLTYVSATKGDALPTLAFTKPGSAYEEGKLTFAWDAMEADFTNGTLLTFTFEVAAGAPAGDSAINVAVNTMCDFDFNDITNQTVAGKVTVEAAKLTTVTVGEVTDAEREEEVTVPVTLTNNAAGICGLTLTFTYDANALTYVSATKGDALPTLAFTKPGSAYEEGELTFAWDAMDPDFTNGKLLDFVFKVNADAKGGDHVIDVAVKTMCDFDFNDIPNETVAGKVNVYVPHVHDYIGIITTPATHLTEGVRTYTCECGDSYTEAVEKLAEHEWDAGVVTTPATHLAEGVMTYTCPCGETKTEAIAKLAEHEWDAGTITTPATHLVEGVKTYTCPCGETKTEAVEKLAEHEWDAGTITTPATHLVEGVKTYTCPCGETKTEAVEKLAEHEWDAGVITTPATHTTAGVMTYTCPCGEQKTETIAPDESAHDWGTGVITTPATHLTEGVMTYTCICGETKTEAVPVLTAHEWDDGVITTPATCTEDGVKTYTCPCGETYTEVVVATGHSHGNWVKDDDINHKKVCACGDTITEEHTWNAGEITTNPTYGKDGVKTYTCPICNGTKTESIPMKDSEATDINIVAGEVTARAGQDIRIPISISNNSGITGLQLGFDYDPNLMTLTSIEKGGALAALDFTEPGDLSASSLVFLWDGLDADSTTGDILYLNFTLSNTALGGSYNPVAYVIMTADQNAQEVPVYVVNGGVNVIEYTHGDVDADSEVDVQDIVFLRRELVGGYDQTITAEAGDVYKDGELNVQDVVYLRRFVIGGYDVQLPVWPSNN